jgi:hypothetical protein
MRLSYFAAAVILVMGGTRAAIAREIMAGSVPALIDAIKTVTPGDEIVLADGVYHVSHKILIARDGTRKNPITLRAAHPGRAKFLSSGLILFEVSAAYWHFENLDIAGMCVRDTDCEHAFHVIGAARGFVLRRSRLADFNAHIKVNADTARQMPGNGLIEGNEFFDSHPRHTDNPVAPINIDNAIGWIVRDNFIHDFQKDGSGEGSYGAFVKGGSLAPIIEKNLVACASTHKPMGKMVGLSFGAHGMMPILCPPAWDAAKPCNPEVTGGIMRNNIVRDCNDDGIYLNRAHDSHIMFNTVTGTAGIEFRYAGSDGVARGNLVAGGLRVTEGGKLTDLGNVTAKTSDKLIRLPSQDAAIADDFCGRGRGKTLDYGAEQTSIACPPMRGLWADQGAAR